MGKLSKELKELTPYEIDNARFRLYQARDVVDRDSNMSFEDRKVVGNIIGIIIEVLIFARQEFWRDNAFKIPFLLNIPKWIRVIVFFIQKIKEIVKLTKA